MGMASAAAAPVFSGPEPVVWLPPKPVSAGAVPVVVGAEVAEEEVEDLTAVAREADWADLILIIGVSNTPSISTPFPFPPQSNKNG